MSTDRPTPDDAAAAMAAVVDTIGLDGVEDVLDTAVGYLQDRLAHYGENPLWGRNTGIAAAAMALAIRAYAKATASVEHVDAWDVSRMEHETDVLRDRVRGLEEENARLQRLLAQTRRDKWSARWDAAELQAHLDAARGPAADAATELTRHDQGHGLYDHETTTAPTHGGHTP